jgi:hypothetical protein
VLVRQAIARALTLQSGISRHESIPMSVLHESSMSAARREEVLHEAKNCVRKVLLMFVFVMLPTTG